VPGHPGRYLEGRAGFRAAIRAHWFALVSFPSRSLDQWDSWEQLELRAVLATPGYRLVPASSVVGAAGLI
jgi:hypothetical protein